MLPGKRAISLSDTNRCGSETNISTPKKFMCIPNNTPEESPIADPIHTTAGNSKAKNLPSSNCSNFLNHEFQNQLLKALITKFPDKLQASENTESDYITIPTAIPVISLSQDAQSMMDDEAIVAELSIENVKNYNCMAISGSFNEMEWDQRSFSLSDQVSTRAICASEISNLDSISDIEISFPEDIARRTQSISLDDLECHGNAEKYCNSLHPEDLKWYKRATSLDDLHDSLKYTG